MKPIGNEVCGVLFWLLTLWIDLSVSENVMKYINLSDRDLKSHTAPWFINQKSFSKANNIAIKIKNN